MLLAPRPRVPLHPRCDFLFSRGPHPVRRPRRRRSRGRLAFVLLCAGLAAGCRPETPRVQWLDLAAALPLAEVERETAGTAADQDGSPRASADGLYLPFGSRVSYYSTPPEGSAFVFDAVEPRGRGRGWIEVASALEGDPLEPRGRLEASGVGSLEIPGGGGRAQKLTVRAVAADADGPVAGGLFLRRPAIAVPAADVEPAPRAEGKPDRLPPRRLNVIVYLIDTLRRDHLGCYGYPRPISPAIDAFARESITFDNAVAQSPWTRPSVVSLFTGVWPRTHGVNGRKDRLAPEALTLAEILRENGWRTAGFVTNRNVARTFGLAQGFETYHMLRQEDSSEEVHREAVAWLESRRREGGEEPFFLYLHTVEPHSSYQPPEPYRSRFAADVPRDGTGARWWLKELKRGEIPVTDELLGHLRDLYDAEIAANDASFGKLVQMLEETGLADETVVVLVSDHGEEFFEHGRWEHGKSLHTEVLDVPFVLRLPGVAGERFRGLRVAEPVQHTDLLPTLLAFLGVPIPEAVEGRDLALLLESARAGVAAVERERPPEVFSYLDLDGFEAAAVTTRDWRLIDGRSEVHGRGSQLFDRRSDPREQIDRMGERPVTGGYLRACLRARELAPGEVLAPGEAVIDDETREQLRALGYLD